MRHYIPYPARRKREMRAYARRHYVPARRRPELHTAIGIEHVGLRDGDVLGDARRLRASLRLRRWLRWRYGIAIKDVIGHNESVTSPYHRERVAALRHQTHGDWARASMVRYRARLRTLPCPS